MSGSSNGAYHASTLTTGPFHPTLENALLEHLSRRADADRPDSDPLAETQVVVPTNLLGLRLSRLLARRIGGHANVRFMTMIDLAMRVAGTPLPDGRVVLPRGADEVALRKLLDGGLAAGGYFERIADKPGLAGTLLATIRDLKEACYTVDSLADAAGRTGLLRKGRDCKLTEFLHIWRAYEKELRDGGWADTLDAMAAAAERTATGTPERTATGAAERLEAGAPERTATGAVERTAMGAVSGAPDGAALVVYGFYDLNSLQRRLIAGHAVGDGLAAGYGLTVFFPFLDIAAFDYARPTLAWLESLGLTRVDLQCNDARDVPLPPEVRIISAPGEAREAREDVRELTGLLDDHDAGFQGAAVLARTLDRYSELFREECEHIGARPFLAAPPPLSRTRSGRSLIKLAEAVASDFARLELMEFLTLADLSTDGERAPVADWNKATILAGITSGAGSWTVRLGTLRDRLERADGASRFAAAHGHLLAPIGQLLRLLEGIVPPLEGAPAHARVGEYVDLLTTVFRDVTARSKERERVLRAAGATRTLSEVAGEVTFPYFLELLRATLGQPGGREERFGTGGPSVLNLMNARGLRFPVVILPGLVEKEFPAAHRQDPVLLDSERERLNTARRNDPMALLPIRSANVDEERLLFHLAVATAEETLILSYPRLDPASARPRVPSLFVLRALDELTGVRHDYERLELSERVTRVPLSRRFPDDRRTALTREEFDGCSVLEAVESGDAGEVAYLIQGKSPLARGLEMERTRWSTPAFTRYDAMLVTPAAVAAVADLLELRLPVDDNEIRVSPTALEDYARCPFRFFMGHVLGVEPIEEPEEVLHLSPLERGSLYHEVLERFMRRAKAEGLLPLSTEARKALFEVAADVAGSGKWSLAGLAGARELLLRDLFTSLSLWLATEALEDSVFVPAYFETRFGGKLRPGDDETLSTEEGMPFEAAGGLRVSFSGKIDRVDVSHDGTRARVVDYKTGKPQNGRTKVLDGGKRLQLPVYLLAASRMLASAHPGAVVESAQYFYIGSGEGPSRMVLERERLEGAMDDLATAVAYVIRGVTSGVFIVPPHDSNCSFCDYADACGSTAGALSEMKRGDRKIEFYTEQLGGIE